ncbi:MAG: pyridoxamine 5'-phosphate oxidase family protein [Solirubrobacteraceae bacterium]
MTNDDIARTIVDTATYVVLATADTDGAPWASPVWFANEHYRQLLWVSHPGARHSQNIAVRPQIAMVVFDPTVAPNAGQGVYMTATAERLTDSRAVEHGIGIFSRAYARQTGEEFNLDRVTGDARLRLYRARVHEHSILDPDSPFDIRVGVSP